MATKSDQLDLTEFLLIMAILRHGSKAYGISLQETVIEVSKRKLSLAATYAALDRLESKGFVESRLGEATKQRGGKRKRLYRVTATGQRILNNTAAGIRSLASGLDLNWGPVG